MGASLFGEGSLSGAPLTGRGGAGLLGVFRRAHRSRRLRPSQNHRLTRRSPRWVRLSVRAALSL